MRANFLIIVVTLYITLIIAMCGCTVTVNVQRYQDTDIVHPHEVSSPKVETREIIKTVPGPTVVKNVPSPPKVVYRNKPYPVVTFPDIGPIPKSPNLDDPSLDNADKINDELIRYIRQLKHYIKDRDEAGKKNVEASKH